MRLLLPFVLLMMVFKKDCQASDGFGYEVLIGKMEYLDQKIDTLKNETIQQEKQRNGENSLVKLQNKNNQQEERRQHEIFEQNSKILQIINKIYQRIEPIESCTTVHELGRHKLKVRKHIFEVFCEQELYGGGWIVIQNRFDGSVDFYRNWTEYRNGFGNLDGEFWLGLQKIYLLTSSRNYELLVHLEDFSNEVLHARYQRFTIGSENEQYMLKTLGLYNGTAENTLTDSISEKFSTYDRDNDRASKNCAVDRHGAWWYWNCAANNLNGMHKNAVSKNGMYWARNSQYHGMKVSKMMIRDI